MEIDGVECDDETVKDAVRRVSASVTHIQRFHNWKPTPSMRDYDQLLKEIVRILRGERDIA